MNSGASAARRCAFRGTGGGLCSPHGCAKRELVLLSKREFDIVELLSLHAGQVFDRERIYETVWGIDGEGNSDTIMEHIRKIRAKFAVHTLHSYIETVWGVGINGTAEKWGCGAPFLWCLCSAWRQPCC